MARWIAILFLSIAAGPPAWATTCTGIFHSQPTVNPFTALFESGARTDSNPAQKIRELALTTGLSDSDCAENFWEWLRGSRPERALSEEAPYIKDVLEISFPLYRRYLAQFQSQDLRGLSDFLADTTLRMSNHAPADRFHRSGRQFRLKPGLLDFDSELLGFMKSYSNRLRSVSSDLITEAEKIRSPKKWSKVVAALETLQKEIQKQKKVSLATALVRFSNDFVMAHQLLQGFKANLDQLNQELNALEALRLEVIETGESNLEKLRATEIAFDGFDDLEMQNDLQAHLLESVLKGVVSSSTQLTLNATIQQQLSIELREMSAMIASVEELLVPSPTQNDIVKGDVRYKALLELAAQLKAGHE